MTDRRPPYVPPFPNRHPPYVPPVPERYPPYVPPVVRQPPIIVRPVPYELPPRPYVQPDQAPGYAPPAPGYSGQAPGYAPPAPAYSGPAPANTPAPVAAAPTCPCPDLGTYLLIAFQPTATTTDITNLLKTYELQMASGPDESGAYRVLVSKGQVPPDQLSQLAQAIGAQTNVVAQVSNN